MKQKSKIQSRISRHGANRSLDETRTSKITDGDATTTSRVIDPAASPCHGPLPSMKIKSLKRSIHPDTTRCHTQNYVTFAKRHCSYYVRMSVRLTHFGVKSFFPGGGTSVETWPCRSRHDDRVAQAASDGFARVETVCMTCMWFSEAIKSPGNAFEHCSNRHP